MANVMTVNDIDKGLGNYHVFGSIALSGNYVQEAGAGEVLDFTKLVNLLGNDLPVSGPPISFAAWGRNGYNYGTQAWTTLQQKLKVSTASATELAAGAYPAGVTGDTIYFEAVFNANV